MMDLTKSQILITGGGGFVGRNLVEHLLVRGVPATNIAAPSRVECDFSDSAQAAKAMYGKDLVFHVAAKTGGVSEHRDHPGDIIRENVLVNATVIEAARVGGVKKIITIGSAAVYSADKKVPYHEDSIWGSRYEEIHLPYAFSKLLLLVMGDAYHKQYGMNVVHLIMTNMYGPGDDGRSGYVIPTLIKRVDDAIKNKVKSIEVWGTGNSTRDFLYIDDAVRGIVDASEKYEGDGPLNLGSGRETSIRELAETITTVMGFEGKLSWKTENVGEDNRRLLDIKRARATIGFKPATDLEDGIRRSVEWLRKKNKE